MTERAESVESVEQLASAWRGIVLDRGDGADVRDLPGIAVRWADSRFVFWNCVTLTEPDTDPELTAQRLAQAADIMRAKRHPGFLWLFEDLLGDAARATLERTVGRAGFAYAFSGSGMAGDLLPFPEPGHPDLTFTRVTDEERLGAFADLNAGAYGFAPEDVREGLLGSTFWKSGAHAWIGLRAGTPVTCAAAVEVDGRLFVALVATDPQWQHRGYGEAVTRKVLYEAHRVTGLTRAVLHATPAGAPVYERIGFRPNSPVHFYALKD
ncbi:GNAT family N-acetyltransferase [Streptomyces sp. NPDC088789]|uniref:GNAT family N-acetyltransferase n=1 Tax=Streptomyces sp. NPDC088789 TaxID=3365899 RepID=UPI0037F8316A